MLIQVNKKRTFLFGRKGTFSFGVDRIVTITACDAEGGVISVSR